MQRNHGNSKPLSLEAIKLICEEMLKVGVLKVVGSKMEDGLAVPVYAPVPPEEWSAETRALMGASDGDMPELMAEYPKDRLGQRR